MGIGLIEHHGSACTFALGHGNFPRSGASGGTAKGGNGGKLGFGEKVRLQVQLGNEGRQGKIDTSEGVMFMRGGALVERGTGVAKCGCCRAAQL